MPKHCCWGQCTSDSRYPKPDVSWIPFPKPITFPEVAQRWIFLCGRGTDFKVAKITKNTYICSRYFLEGAVLDLRYTYHGKRDIFRPVATDKG